MHKGKTKFATKHHVNPVRFNLKSRRDINAATLIIAVFRYGPHKLVYSTRQKIKPRFWNDKTKRPQTYFTFYKELKEELDKIEFAIIETIKREKRQPEPQKFKEILDLKLERTKEKSDKNSFIAYFDEYIELRKLRPNANELTIKKFVSTQNHLELFVGTKDLLFDDIDWMFREKFLNWCYSKPREHSVNTASKNVQIIIQIMKDAYRNKKHKNDICEDPGFRVKRIKTRKIALNEEEVQALYDMDLSDDLRLDKARDLFLISCYSSLRISDFEKIKPENIIEEKEGLFLHLYTSKGTKQVYIPIMENLLTILKKYDYHSPKISKQRFNEYIKDVCEEAKFKNKEIVNVSKAGKNEVKAIEKYKLISAHTGRRTWASIHYSKGYPIVELMQVTGHTKESTFLSYIGISDKEKAKSLMRRMKEMAHGKNNLKVV